MIFVIPHLKIHNANALSSPFTIGFPAMTAWLGAAHALQRKLHLQGWEHVQIKGVGICCHNIQVHRYKGSGDFEYSIIGTGNPLTKKGERAPFLEEPRCDLDVSILLSCTGLRDQAERTAFAKALQAQALQMKWASGDVFAEDKASGDTVCFFNENSEKDTQKLRRQLMPGYVVIERRDLMVSAMEKGEDALDALLGYLQVTSQSEVNDSGEVSWKNARKSLGWLVPLATGFHGISELGKAVHQRDAQTPHRFAESVVTLGEFKMPTRLSVDEMLWYYRADLENNLYLCEQNQNKEK